MKLSEYLDREIGEFWASKPGGAATFTNQSPVVVTTPAPTVPGQQVRLYKWACELIGEPDINVRAKYGTDAEIVTAYQNESADGFPDAQRHKFLPRW